MQPWVPIGPAARIASARSSRSRPAAIAPVSTASNLARYWLAKEALTPLSNLRYTSHARRGALIRMAVEPKTITAGRKAMAGLLVLAVLAGLAITWLDSRPGWDDTGVTAGLILLTSGGFAAIRPARPWLWAVAVGGWTPLLGIASSGNYGSVLALAVSFLGAYSGALVVKTIRLFR